MRAQLSLELMIYTAISAVSLVAVLAMYLHAQAAQGQTANRAYVAELAALINTNMAYSNSRFAAYLSAGLCNATTDNGTLVTRYGTFALNGQLTIAANALCISSSGVESLNMAELYNGTFELYR